MRLAELARQAGVDPEAVTGAFVRSLQPAGVLSRPPSTATRSAIPTRCSRCEVNGADLSLDHGYPARIIVPALPGVHNTKWVASITFAGAPVRPLFVLAHLALLPFAAWALLRDPRRPVGRADRDLARRVRGRCTTSW